MVGGVLEVQERGCVSGSGESVLEGILEDVLVPIAAALLDTPVRTRRKGSGTRERVC